MSSSSSSSSQTTPAQVDAALDNLCRKVDEVAHVIVQHSRQLADLVKETTNSSSSSSSASADDELEKSVIQAAKAAAKETAALVDLINAAPQVTQQAKKVQLGVLRNAARDCSTAVLALIGSTKKAIANPFDFITKQDVGNKCKEVAATIQGVQDATKTLSALCRSSMGGLGIGGLNDDVRKETDRLLQATIIIADEAAKSIRRLEDAARTGQKAGFVSEAKVSATKLAQLIETAKSLGIEKEGTKLKQASLKIISAGKVALRSPEDELYKQQLATSKSNAEEAMSQCLMAIQSKLLAKRDLATQAQHQSSSSSSSSSSPHHHHHHRPAHVVVSGSSSSSSSSSSSLPPRSMSMTSAKSPTTPDPHPPIAGPRLAGNLSPRAATASHSSPTQPGALASHSHSHSHSQSHSHSHHSPSSTSSLPSGRDVREGLSNSGPSSHPGSPLLRRGTGGTGTQLASRVERLRGEASWEGISKRYSLPAGQIQEAVANYLTQSQTGSSSGQGSSSNAGDASPRALGGNGSSGAGGGGGKDISIADKIVQSLEEKYPELKGRRSELLATVVSELDDATLNGSETSGIGSAAPSAIGELPAKSDLERIVAMESYSEWRRMTLTRRQANKAKDFVDLAADEEDESSSSASGKDFDAKQVPALLKTISDNLGDSALEFIVTANENVINPRAKKESLEDTVRNLYMIIRKTVRIAKSMANHFRLPEVMVRIIDTVQKMTEEARTRGILEEDCVEAATTLAAKMAELNLQKRVFFESNAVRVLTIQLLSAITTLASNMKVSGFYLTLVATARGLTESAGKLLDLVETSVYMSINKHKFSSSTLRPGEMTLLAEDDSEPNLWEDAENAENEIRYDSDGSKSITCASLNRLIEALTSADNYDSNFLHTFITTYQSFTTPHRLFEKLLERYNVPEGKMDEKQKQAVRLRVSVVLKYWVSNQFSDLDDDMILRVTHFVDNTLKNDGYDELAGRLKNEISSKCPVKHVMDVFLNTPVQDIAEQLTLLDFNLYAAIEPSELLNQSWNNNKLKYRAPNVIAMINRANSVSFWVASMILWHDKGKERKKVTEKFIQIAEYLRKLNNFNTLMGLVAGLNTSSVNRLKATKADLGKKVLASFAKLEQLMHPQSSFKNYRDHLHEASPPCIPYLGVYLTDLTFIEDGNPDEIDNRLVNFYKRQLVYRVIQEVKQYQATKYTFVVRDPLRVFLTALPVLADKQLYDLSLQHEPREGKKK